MQIEPIEKKILAFRSEGKRLFTSSSFQTHSLVLLHIISRIDKSIPVVFINTGYHFPETIRFRDEMIERLGLQLIDLKPDTPKNQQMGQDGRLLFTSDPDYCCYLNKTHPMERILMTYDVWINGVRSEQSAERGAMRTEQKAPFDTIRYHPLLDWDARQVFEYRKKFDLPEHPLDSQGYISIGCEPCTRKLDPEMLEREARWYGLSKTECGLHVDLISK